MSNVMCLLKNKFLRFIVSSGCILILMVLLTSCLYDNTSINPDQPPTPDLSADIISPISPVEIAPPSQTTMVEVSESGFEGCIVFASNRFEDFDIFKVSKNNSLEQLTSVQGFDIDPAWSPTGEKIVFASNRNTDNGFQIYTMNNDGTDQQQLGSTQPGDNTRPDWSPDGFQIVFQSKRDLNGNSIDDNFDIYVMNNSGDNIDRLTFDNSDDTDPTWSPDGEKIAFLSERTGQDEVYIMNADGTELEQLTQLSVLKSGLDWSPDSGYLIFEGNGSIFVLDVKTKDIEEITPFETANAVTPNWGEDENFILFSSDYEDEWNIYLLDRRDPQSLHLTQFTRSEGINRNPTWFSCQ